MTAFAKSGSSVEIRPFRRASLPVTLVAVLAYWLLLAAVQYAVGARLDPFSAYPDEPAHYMSGLLVRDYAASLFHSGSHPGPLAFAANYYTHMPFLAIGYWPPLFYGIEGVWMMIFGWQRFSVLLLIALLCSLVAGTCFRVLSSYLGRAGAFFAALLFFILPATQWSMFLVMTDVALGLFFLWFGLAFARWAEAPTASRAVQAGLLLTCALFTKFTAFVLFGVPLVFFLVTMRWDLMRKASFWLIALVVCVFWGPWILRTHALLGIGYVDLVQQPLLSRFTGYGAVMLKNLSWLILPCAVGIGFTLKRAREDYSGVVCVIVPLCYSVFLIGAGIGFENRFMLPILIPLIIPVGIGLFVAARSFRFSASRIVIPAVSVAAFLLAVGTSWHQPTANNIRPVVSFIETFGDPRENSVLVPTAQEGSFVAEFAGREARPGRLLIRPTKLLASENWGGGSYLSKFKDEKQLIDLFDDFPIRFIVIAREGVGPESPHDSLLRTMLRGHPDRWSRREMPPAKIPSPWEVYERSDGRRLRATEMLAHANEVLGPRLRSVGAIQ